MTAKEETINQIKYILDKLQPYLAADGGGVEFIDYDENTGIVSVRMLAACADCGMSDVTLKLGIERALVDEVPGVNGVTAV